MGGAGPASGWSSPEYIHVHVCTKSLLVSIISFHTFCFRISHDRGDCFLQQTLDTTNVFQLTRGLLIDPSAGSLYAFVMGVEGTGVEDEWKVIALNFGSLLTRRCSQSDYQLYQEHEKASYCLMGYKVHYNVTKETAVCSNEPGFNYRPVKKTKCSCDYNDYEW